MSFWAGVAGSGIGILLFNGLVVAWRLVRAKQKELDR